MQEKLTHVNTHAKLSIDITFKAIKAVENIIRKEGTAVGIQHAMEKTIQEGSENFERRCNSSFPGDYEFARSNLCPPKKGRTKSFS